LLATNIGASSSLALRLSARWMMNMPATRANLVTFETAGTGPRKMGDLGARGAGRVPARSPTVPRGRPYRSSRSGARCSGNCPAPRSPRHSCRAVLGGDARYNVPAGSSRRCNPMRCGRTGVSLFPPKRVKPNAGIRQKSRDQPHASEPRLPLFRPSFNPGKLTDSTLEAYGNRLDCFVAGGWIA
jgi:hypothetical protein